VRYIISNSVSENIVEGFGFWDVDAGFPDDRDKFAFVIETGAFLCERVDWYWVCGACEGGNWLVLEGMSTTNTSARGGSQIERGILGLAYLTAGL
jgi:hypothetical protein